LAKPDKVKSDRSPRKDPYRTPVEFTAREALRTRALWLLVAYGTLQFLVMGGLMTHQVAFLFDIGISSTMAAMALGILSAAMGISQLGIGFLGLRFQMHSLAIISMIMGIIGFAVLLFARSLPVVLAYSVIYGTSQGIQSIAMGNLFPDYFGRTEFPKIFGYTSPITTIVSSFGAPITGHIRDIAGSYIPAFRILFVLLAVSFFCIFFAKPPAHPSLKASHA
jgi:MFS family permease